MTDIHYQYSLRIMTKLLLFNRKRHRFHEIVKKTLLLTLLCNYDSQTVYIYSKIQKLSFTYGHKSNFK